MCDWFCCGDYRGRIASVTITNAISSIITTTGGGGGGGGGSYTAWYHCGPQYIYVDHHRCYRSVAVVAADADATAAAAGGGGVGGGGVAAGGRGSRGSCAHRSHR
jgi:hypothetical protein